MPQTLVTGGAGFIGSAVVRHLLDADHDVTVVDALPTSRQRLAVAAFPRRVRVIRTDLRTADLRALLRGHDRVIHLAGTPGVQTSWADGFRDHLDGNLALTQGLLEASLDVELERVVLASSSSVYGHTPTGQSCEDDPLLPVSPYGVSKAAMEMLAGTYALRGVPITSLRYFTVVGPGQRPDMAVHRLIEAALTGEPFPLRGDGSQVRDLTAVNDIARATVLAATTRVRSGTAINIGGGEPISLRDLIALVSDIMGAPIPIQSVPAVPGDPGRTASDTTRATRLLGWTPRSTLASAVAAQVQAHLVDHSRASSRVA